MSGNTLPTGTPPSAALEQFLRDSYDTVQAVHRDLDAIRAVASHLTPVEDLVEFQNEIAALYAKLGVLVYASELLIRATPAGIALLIAEDAPAQRVLLGLRSAALRDASYFAVRADFDQLVVAVGLMGDQIQAILAELATKVSRDELAAALAPILDELERVGSGIGPGFDDVNERVTLLISQLQNGEYGSTALATALESLTTRVEQTEQGYLAESQKLVQLTADVEDLEQGLAGSATAMQGLLARVETNEQGIVSVAEDTTALGTAITNLETGQEAQGTALQQLSTRTGQVEGELFSQSDSITHLTAGVQDALTQTAASAFAIQGLTARTESTEAGQLSLANSVDQLGAQIVDLDSGLVGQADALSELESRVVQTQDSLVIASEERTALRASLGSTGNYLPNAGFLVDTRNWFLFSRGDGWLDAQLSREVEPSTGAMPANMYALGIEQDEVPSGHAGIRSSMVPVEDLGTYILSGYLAAENCTIRLEWRLFDGAGIEIGYGLAGQVTNEDPSARLSGWTRVHAELPVDADGAQLQVQVWVVDCNTGFPKAWLLRPQLERKIGEQIGPSPWMEGVGGMEESFATAVQTLTTKIEQTDGQLDILAQSITDLSTATGALTHWYICHHVGSSDYIEAGAPEAPGLYPVLPGGTLGDVAHTFQRGLTLLQFDMTGGLATAQRFDTFSNTTERNNLRDALFALNEGSPFLLVSQDHHGIKNEDLTAALEFSGASAYAGVPGSRPYLLKSVGQSGKGWGTEVMTIGERAWQAHYFSLINDTPIGLGEGTGVANAIAAQGQAMESLSTQISQNETEIGVLSSAQTDLSGRVLTAENSLQAQGQAQDALTVRVNQAEDEIESQVTAITNLSSQIEDLETGVQGAANANQALDVRVTANETGVAAVSAAQLDLDARVETTESALIQEMITSAQKDAGHTSAINLLETRINDPESGLVASATGLSELTTRVGTVEGKASTHTTQLTNLQAQVNALDVDAGGSGQAIADLSVRVDEVEDGIDTHSSQITALQNSVTSANKVFAQNNAPSTSGRTDGDIWIDTNDGNRLYTYAAASNSWVARPSAGSVFLQGTQPTARNVGDLWFDTSRNNRQFRWSGSAWVEVSDTRVVANTSAISSLTSRTTTAEGKISTHTGQLTTLQAQVNALDVDTGGSGQAIADLNTRVDSVEGTVTSQGTAINTLNNKVNHSTSGNTALATAVGGLTTRVTAAEGVNTSQANSINALNSTVNNTTTGVVKTASNVASLTTRVSNVEGVNTSQASSINALNSTVNNSTTGVVKTASNVSALTTRVTNAEGVNSTQATSINTLNTTVGSHTSSITTMSTSVNGLKARHTVRLDVNGHVSGTRSENDGNKSTFSILATVFRVITSGSTGLEWQNGYLRAYSGSIQLVLGINFGASSNLCFWYGPNVGANSCAKNNGTIWFDNAGSAYFGGTLSAGILRNGAQSTQVSNRATVETGRFGTNGNRKVVTYSLSYSNGGMTTSSAQRPSVGNISGSVVLERRRNGAGSWVQVSSMTASGSITHISEPGGVIVGVYLGGSSTYTDNSTGTQDFEYRARVTAHTGSWPWINPLGSAGQLNLSIISIEE